MRKPGEPSAITPGPQSAGEVALRLNRVLLIDDDQFIRTVITTQLRSLGVAQVMETGGDVETVRLLQAGDAFDLIITDLAMPQFDGLQLTRVIATAQPAAAVLYISAAGTRLLSTAMSLAASLGLQVLGSLEKPVSRAALHRMLERFGVATYGSPTPPAPTSE